MVTSLEIFSYREDEDPDSQNVLVSDHGSAELRHLAGVFRQVDATFEPVVEVALPSPPSQHLGLDHVLRAGEIPGDLGSLVVITRYSELLHGDSEILSVTIFEN